MFVMHSTSGGGPYPASGGVWADTNDSPRNSGVGTGMGGERLDAFTLAAIFQKHDNVRAWLQYFDDVSVFPLVTKKCLFVTKNQHFLNRSSV